jgi:hypothetical protein
MWLEGKDLFARRKALDRSRRSGAVKQRLFDLIERNRSTFLRAFGQKLHKLLTASQHCYFSHEVIYLLQDELMSISRPDQH